MLSKTKLAIIVMSLTIQSAAMAGMSAAPTCLPGNVTVPCADATWEVALKVLYLKSLYDANAAYESNSINDNSRYREVDNDWGWGYQLQGAYHFSTGSDITMGWLHYDNDAKQYGLKNDFFALAIPTQPLAEYNVALNNTFDQVNLVMGQHADLGMFKNVRFYGGLQYARIRAESSSQFTNVPFNQFSRTTFSDSKGVGPVIGIDYSYDMANGLSLVANAASAIIYGNGRYSSGFIREGTLVLSASYATKKIIMPALEAKLGVNYAYTAPMGTLNVEAGYQALNYFNALQTRGATALGRLTDTDFGLYGPYLGLHWVGNA